MMKSRMLWPVLMITGFALTSCSTSGTDDSAAKVPGLTPLNIHIVDSQEAGRPSNLPLETFAQQAKALSNGAIVVTVDASSLADPTEVPEIEKVRAGTAQMAVVKTSAWPDEKVSTFRALNVPFVVTNAAQVAAIVSTPAVVDPMMAGLEPIGLHGLTMFPESLRHLFSFGTPLLAPNDLKGRKVRVPSAPDVAALVTALGGVPVDPPYDSYVAGVKDGSITVHDSGFPVHIYADPIQSTTVGNLPLYPKVITLVANGPWWTSLSDEQRSILQKAAYAARTWAIEHQGDETAGASSYCHDGGTVVLATAAELDAWRTAAASFTAQLTQQPGVAASAAAIAAAIASVPTGSSLASGCGAAPAAPTPTSVLANDAAGSLNGVYRHEYTDDYLRSKGVTVPKDLRENHGVFTFTLQNGRWSLDQIDKEAALTTHMEGVYSVENGEVLWWWPHEMVDPQNGPVIPLHVAHSADGSITLTQVEPYRKIDWVFGVEWQRVGNP